MDIFLFVLGFFFVLLGIFGSIAPALPGPPLGWIGILMLYLTKAIAVDYWVLGITLFLALLVTVLDYVIPAIGTKKFGGTKYGMWGTTIGLIVGFFIPIPLGFIFGSIIGAFLGELIYDSKDTKRVTKAAFGSFIGFVSSTLLKVVLSISFLVLFIKIVWDFRASLFG